MGVSALWKGGCVSAIGQYCGWVLLTEAPAVGFWLQRHLRLGSNYRHTCYSKPTHLVSNATNGSSRASRCPFCEWSEHKKKRISPYMKICSFGIQTIWFWLRHTVFQTVNTLLPEHRKEGCYLIGFWAQTSTAICQNSGLYLSLVMQRWYVGGRMWRWCVEEGVWRWFEDGVLGECYVLIQGHCVGWRDSPLPLSSLSLPAWVCAL